ncbi:hypothetical protein EVAR_5753_1 [Eumeta japonica]|uniref:Uncharacterized protein n=1 Tax=Eumeta variegata TaxID=151549 RepID=A0A4C1T520_EUMVA|nr:hypothetical protein EVAR_5753_1 [Eumeta japonica]
MRAFPVEVSRSPGSSYLRGFNTEGALFSFLRRHKKMVTVNLVKPAHHYGELNFEVTLPIGGPVLKPVLLHRYPVFLVYGLVPKLILEPAPPIDELIFEPAL